MKKLLTMMGVSIVLFSCKTPEPVAVVPPASYVVDDYYILMSDAYHLRPGMHYEEVKAVLKQDPYEIHQNIQDNCIVLSYHMKRNKRIHEETQQPVPMAFYASADPTNLTYAAADAFYLILDSDQKTLRSYFSQPNDESIERYNMLLRRGKKVCEDPKNSEEYMRLWGKTTTTPAVELSLKGFLGR
jgi:hypothetical protein